MSADDQPEATLQDLVFPLAGHSLPRDHGQALQEALLALLPWLAAEPLAGIHPVKLVPGGEAQALLSQRTRLLLRLPRRQLDAAGELAGRTIEVGGCSLQLGVPHGRELLPHATLYASAVAASGDDEAVFMQAMAQEIQALQLRSQWVCGKRHHRQLQGRPLTTFSLMLHGLSPAHSLRLQEHGLGAHRLLGCGLFVPHKSAAAVGD